MKTKLVLFVSIILLLVNCDKKTITFERPPLAKTEPVEDVYFGKKLIDDYRYMEDLKDTLVIDWFKKHANRSNKVLQSLPGRQGLIDKMMEFDKRVSSSVSRLKITDNDYYFYLKTTPEDETGKLYYRKGFEGEEVFLYDPLTFSTDTIQKHVIMALLPSDDGSKVVFNVAEGGTENGNLVIMDVTNKKIYPEKIDRVWFGLTSWLPDGTGFIFNRLNPGDVHEMSRELNTKTYLHMVGTEPSSDKDILSNTSYPDLGILPEEFPFIYYNKTSGYLLGGAGNVDSRIKVYYAPVTEIHNEVINWKPLILKTDEVYDLDFTKEDIYLYTPKDAPNFKIIKTSLKDPDIKNAEVVIAEDNKAKLNNYSLTSDGLYYTLSYNGVQEKLFFLANGSEKPDEIKLPFTSGKVVLSDKGVEYSDFWVTIAGWTNDYQRYRYLPKTKEFKLENLSTKAEFPEFNDFVAEELMIASHDGVEVPLSLIYNKELKRDAQTPVFFLGYGAYGISVEPFFWPNLLQWVNKGGVLAIPHVRGGGELGDQWYKAGYKTTKPNTWKDLIACVEYMIKEQYTNPDKIAIWGGSAGGILIGRAMTERPDLFAAVIPDVGCMNTVRGENSPNGPVNIPEFGTVKDSVECMALIEMDSYHHLEKGVKYPATLVTAGMNDPRVIAWQPGKFAARLQEYNASDMPILFLPDFEAGHGIGDTKSKKFESLANNLSFAFWHTGHPDFQLE